MRREGGVEVIMKMERGEMGIVRGSLVPPMQVRRIDVG